MIDNNQVDKLVAERIEKITSVLLHKRKEYSPSGDPFHNFNEGLAISTCTSQEEYMWNLGTKHLQSVKDMIEYPKKYSKEYINEKIGDAVNYLILIEAFMISKSQDEESES